ncbi:MAG TPA: phosphatase PAP2 family protein [Segetibacter sp.]
MNIIERLVNVDRKLFYVINNQLSLSRLNPVMLLLREAYTWIPVYLFFLIFYYLNCRKFFMPFVLLTVLTFTITDFTSASILKPLFARFRPCHDPAMQLQINNISGCGGLFSMPSSHASNHFGLSAFWFLVIKHTLGRRWFLLWVWAFVIGYAQIYVGVHYPGDILAGALLGIATANFTFRLFKKWTNDGTAAERGLSGYIA